MQVPPHVLQDEQLAHDDAEDEEHVVPLTSETFKEFVEGNEFVMVNFVSSLQQTRGDPIWLGLILV